MADGAPGLDWESGNTLFVMWVGINVSSNLIRGSF